MEQSLGIVANMRRQHDVAESHYRRSLAGAIGISGTRLRIGPIEAIDGTPVVDVKPVQVEND